MKSLVARFWEKVNRTEGCWEWQGARTVQGYGILKVERKNVYAHRLAWEFVYGFIQPSLCVLHRCDNRKCVRPSHLFLGTRLDNSKDRDAKGRQRNGINPGERNGSAKLSSQQVREIRQLYDSGRYSLRDLAAQFVIGRSQVHRIVRSESWLS